MWDPGWVGSVGQPMAGLTLFRSQGLGRTPPPVAMRTKRQSGGAVPQETGPADHCGPSCFLPHLGNKICWGPGVRDKRRAPGKETDMRGWRTHPENQMR